MIGDVLIDTSVWVRFLYGRTPVVRDAVQRLLLEDAVVRHPWVQAELVLGNQGGRAAFLAQYVRMRTVPVIDIAELLAFIDHRKLAGRGIGLADAQLLAACLAARTRLYTVDSALRDRAEELDVAYTTESAP
jgi:predicted nucleic acid-binding protein